LIDQREGPIAKSQGSLINISMLQCTIHELFRVDTEQTLIATCLPERSQDLYPLR